MAEHDRTPFDDEDRPPRYYFHPNWFYLVVSGCLLALTFHFVYG